MVSKIALNTLTLIWYGFILSVIYIGWMVRDERYLLAESGIGYWLGILGGSFMLLLLVYPVRKRKPRWNYTGSVKLWFRIHMFLGIVGPVLIILHSGYRLGSLNGSVAFFSMIIVASSGLVGRYLYRRIHHGLYGEKIKFEELYLKEEGWEQQLESIKQKYPEIVEKLQDFEQKLLIRHTGLNRSHWFFQSMKWKLSGFRKQIVNTMERSDDRDKLLSMLSSFRSICNLGINEILFSYWHILHFPLFIMLVFSGITHVVVVHFY